MQDSNAILTINNLSVKFSLDFYRQGTIRDKFIEAFTSPHTFFIGNQTPFYAVNSLSLTLNSGDRVGILGRNGAGKTTLCRTISKMISPTSGTVKCRGNVRSIYNTSIGILPELTGRENLELLSYFIYPELENRQRADLLEDVIGFSDLGSFIDTPFQHYSRGMQVRIFLSLVSAKPADILILDEVFDGADIFFQQKVNLRFKTLLDKSGAVLFVSHNIEQIKSVCNRVIILDSGKLIFDGNVAEGIEKYSSTANIRRSFHV